MSKAPNAVQHGSVRHVARLIILSLAFYMLLVVLGGWLQGNNVTTEIPATLQDEALRAEYDAMRRPVIDPDDAPLFYTEVDYSEGENASWWPKGESPLLSKLVEDGALPPVHERVGPEPVVYTGFEGIGNYGGDWWHIASDIDAVRLFMTYTANNNTLVRYSPYGQPIKPHLAKAVIPSDNYKTWTVHLRKGVRWSDGHPFTADDIMFWWEHVAHAPDGTPNIPETMRIAGEPGYIEKVDDYTVRYVFPESNPGFIHDQASAAGALFMAGPAHYLRQFHVTLGDQELIAAIAKESQIAPDRVLRERSHIMNPERPSLSPWLFRTHRNNGPWTLIRNPYYFAVDPEGNQLPYIDRIVFQQISPQLISKTIIEGSVSAIIPQSVDYGSLMNNREEGQYRLFHWYPGGDSTIGVIPNRHLPVTDKDPASGFRRDLLRDPTFRHAISIGINRQKIIDARFMGIGAPSNLGPAKGQVGYDPEHLKHAAEYDPERASAMLDELGLTRYDKEGYRTTPDGQRMTFRYVISGSAYGDLGIPLFISEDLKQLGLRVIVQVRPHRLMLMERARADFTSLESSSALGWGALGAGAPYFSWFNRGGLHGSEEALAESGQPTEQEIELMTKGEWARVTPDPEEQKNLVQEIMKAYRENLWALGITSGGVVSSSALLLAKNGLRGIPELIFTSFNHGSPNNAAIETWYWEKPDTINGEPATEEYLANRETSILQEIQEITLPSSQTASEGTTVAAARSTQFMGWVIQYALWTVVALFILMSALRHPFVLRRLALMIPTMIVISIIVYTGIQLPPGSYLDTRVQVLEEQGLRNEAEMEIEDLKERFHMDDSAFKNYFRWTGLLWFTTYQDSDKGLLQGHMGRSMVNLAPVNELMGDRLLLTFVLAIGTILITWMIAIPIGVYSAVRQYSPGDYFFTIAGFLGMCIPNFIFALVLMLLARKYFDITITGLFSPQFAMQDYWNLAKVWDLLKHLWIPLIVIGLDGTAGMIRVMRANLLDELRKPYVTTARAKGVPPVRLLFKYPFRMALLPFISGIGGILPSLISGGAIVSIILSLPTVGPLLLDAVMLEDIYMAGSLLLVLSALSVIGVLVSDLLLMMLDPRIRMTGGGR